MVLRCVEREIARRRRAGCQSATGKGEVVSLCGSADSQRFSLLAAWRCSCRFVAGTSTFEKLDKHPPSPPEILRRGQELFVFHVLADRAKRMSEFEKAFVLSEIMSAERRKSLMSITVRDPSTTLSSESVQPRLKMTEDPTHDEEERPAKRFKVCLPT